MRLQGYRVDVDAVRREPAHPAQHAAARGAHRRAAERRRRLREEYDEPWSPWGLGPELAELLGRELLARAGAGRLVAGAAPGGRCRRRAPGAVFTFTDPAIIESSGLWSPARRAGRDRQRLRRHRPGLQSSTRPPATRSGSPPGATTRPTSRRSRPPGPGGRSGWATSATTTPSRDSVSVVRVPVGRGDRDGRRRRRYELVYPGGARDAETLLVDPRRAGCVVVTKGLLRRGGAAHRRGASTPTRPNRLRAVGAALPIATDGAFFPDGRHLVVRTYGPRSSTPTRARRGRRASALPDQEQGEGIAVDDSGAVLRQQRGGVPPVLRVPLPRAVRRAVAPPRRAAPPSRRRRRARRSRRRCRRAPPDAGRARGGRGAGRGRSPWSACCWSPASAWSRPARSLRPRG